MAAWMLATTLSCPPRAAIAAISSLSVVVWNVLPCASSSRRTAAVFVMFPLWATITLPSGPSYGSGWAFSTRLDPVVE